MDRSPRGVHLRFPGMKTPSPQRLLDQPERDWLQQLRRGRAIWGSVSFVVLAGTVIAFLSLFSSPETDLSTQTEAGAAPILHGRNAGGAAAQLLISSLSPAGIAGPLGAPEEIIAVSPGELEFGGAVGAGAESGPWDAPFLRRKTLTSADVVAFAARYFLEEDVLRAVRLAWCLSRFDPGVVDPLTGHMGLFQHHPSFWPDYAQLAGFRGYDPFDPVANTAVAAYLVYEGAGWQTWDCPM